MRVSAFRAAHELGIEEQPRPRAAAHEVLVRVGSEGIRGSDVHYCEHGRIGRFVVKDPLVPGHEGFRDDRRGWRRCRGPEHVHPHA